MRWSLQWRVGCQQRAVSEALGTARRPPWDFAPAYNASRRYIRNHMGLSALEEIARFPRVGPATS